jgi:branched-subunit amino acid permease
VSLYNYTLALILSVFGIIAVKVNVVEFLIPITILITALLIYLQLANQVKGEYKLSVFITLFFGIIHIGFSNYFKTIQILPSSKLLPLGEFALESRPLK